MTFEITEQDFLNIVDKPNCCGQEVSKGTAEQGHSSCKFCKGNYFVGGECNYGGRHLMTDDLKAINQNFRAFDSLAKHHSKLSEAKNEAKFNEKKAVLLNSFRDLKNKCEDESGAGFFYGSCIGLDGNKSDFSDRIKSTFRRLAKELGYYIDKVTAANWGQVKDYREKSEKLDKMQSEIAQLAKKYQAEKDPVIKKQLLALLGQKQQEAKTLLAELKKSSVYDIFSEEKNEELANIVENIFRGSGQFFKWQEKEKKEEETKKYLGFISPAWGKRILWGSGIILVVLFFYWLIRKFL